MVAAMILHRLPVAPLNLPDPVSRLLAAVVPGCCSNVLERELRAMAWSTTIRAGEVARLDDARDHFAFIDAGATKLVAHASAGREQVVAFHFEGDLVWIPARAAHHYTLNALVRTRLVVVPSAEFLALARDDAAVTAVLFDRALLALHRSREKSVSLGRKSAQERIAAFLATMATRIGTDEGTAWAVDLPMSRRDIADSLGLTIETVSRQFTELRARGLIETSGRSHVRVCNPRGLAACAGHLAAAA